MEPKATESEKVTWDAAAIQTWEAETRRRIDDWSYFKFANFTPIGLQIKRNATRRSYSILNSLHSSRTKFTNLVKLHHE